MKSSFLLLENFNKNTPEKNPKGQICVKELLVFLAVAQHPNASPDLWKLRTIRQTHGYTGI